jgi:hypothetical protein
MDGCLLWCRNNYLPLYVVYLQLFVTGEGGFGFVVHCRKKSTGKHYAMKLQTKRGALRFIAVTAVGIQFVVHCAVRCGRLSDAHYIGQFHISM